MRTQMRSHLRRRNRRPQKTAEMTCWLKVRMTPERERQLLWSIDTRRFIPAEGDRKNKIVGLFYEALKMNE